MERYSSKKSNNDNPNLPTVATEAKSDDSPNLAAYLGFVGGYLLTLVLVAGWAYCHQYFKEFGINFASLEKDSVTLNVEFIGYGLWVFRAYFYYVLGFLIAVFFVYWAWNYIMRGWRAPIFLFFICLAILLTYERAASLGSAYGLAQVQRWNLGRFPQVTVVPKDPTVLKSLGLEGGERCFRKLFMDKKGIYVFAGYAAEQNPPVYFFSLAEIKALKIIKENRPLCES